MLTMLFQVWVDEEGELPQNRGDLFARFINRLLSRERLLLKDAQTGEWRLQPDGQRLLAGLTELAWRMQRERIGTGEDTGVLTVVSRAAAIDVLGSEALLKKALDGTLLEGTSELRFRHQLLQEYFTAQSLQARLKETKAQELWPPDRWWERTGWEEAAILLAGLHAEDCTPVIRWLADAQPDLAADCVKKSGAEIPNPAKLLGELQTAWMPRLLGEREPEARAAVGRALGRLNLDTRPGVGLRPDGLPDIEWVEIPGGKFIYQERQTPQDRSIQHRAVPGDERQFEAFVNAADGYTEDRWWQGMDDPDRNRANPEWSESNHPRETVNWYEAVAFCGWLSHRLGYEIRLPTEWEWERAARGTDGRVYPWGKEYRSGYAHQRIGDAGPHYLGRTSAVGIYAQGASAEGVLDLSGNVWEWCLNEYSNPERVQVSGTESRVLRGGSWFRSRLRARRQPLLLPSVQPFQRHRFPGGMWGRIPSGRGVSNPAPREARPLKFRHLL
jgi:hypothetical protein